VNSPIIPYKSSALITPSGTVIVTVQGVTWQVIFVEAVV